MDELEAKKKSFSELRNESEGQRKLEQKQDGAETKKAGQMSSLRFTSSPQVLPQLLACT